MRVTGSMAVFRLYYQPAPTLFPTVLSVSATRYSPLGTGRYFPVRIGLSGLTGVYFRPLHLIDFD